MEKNFYPHGLFVRYDPKIKALDWEYSESHPLFGYLHWTLFLEQYFANGQPFIDFNIRPLVHVLAEEHRMTVEEFEKFMNSCARLNLIDPLAWETDKQAYNIHALEHMNECNAKYQNMKAARSRAGKASGEARKKKAKQEGTAD